MGDIGIASCIVPFRGGIVSIGIHRKLIGEELLDRRKTSFLSFHKTKDIECDSCIVHFKMPWGLLNAFVSFNTI